MARDLIFLFGFLLITLVIYGRYSKRERVFKNQRSYLSEVISRNQKIVACYHKDLFECFWEQALITVPENACFSRDEIHRYSAICQSVANSIRDSLLFYFRSLSIDLDGKLSVSVKLIVNTEYLLNTFGKDPEKRAKFEKNKQWIITFARDQASIDQGREVGGCIYTIDSNSAYQYLFNSDEVYFCSDNLSSQDGYLNETDNWRKFYNAAIVVPIRYNPAGKSTLSYGFLTVDSPNIHGKSLFLDKHHLVHKECLDVLLHAADILATHSLILRIQTIALPASTDP